MVYALIAAVIIISVAVIAGLIYAVSRNPAEIKYPADKPNYDGEVGEDIVASILGNSIPGEKYVINDLLFKTSKNHSCQIDHIVINKYGIFVIETKNYSGCIYGEENVREWKQILGSVINKFYNPVMQNSTHIYHLSRRLGIKDVFKNIVVFLPRADISCAKSDCVFYAGDLPRILAPSSPAVLSRTQMERCHKILEYIKAHPATDKQEHIENIRKMQESIERGICPRCNGRLVRRMGENGEFYGCSNYPKCTFTKNIESKEISDILNRPQLRRRIFKARKKHSKKFKYRIR